MLHTVANNHKKTAPGRMLYKATLYNLFGAFCRETGEVARREKYCAPPLGAVSFTAAWAWPRAGVCSPRQKEILLTIARSALFTRKKAGERGPSPPRKKR